MVCLVKQNNKITKMPLFVSSFYSFNISPFSRYTVAHLALSVVQTEAERRSGEAVVIQWKEKGLRSCLYEFITSGARRAERVLTITDKSEYERPACRPAGQVTLLKSLYLPNYASDLHTVFPEGRSNQ